MKKVLFALVVFVMHTLSADNQTPTVSPVYLQNTLPFKLKIKQASFQLPNGLHSGSFAVHDGKWLIIGGRTNGLHTFNVDPNNFPPQSQNRSVYVIDPKKKKTYFKTLESETSGLTLAQIDTLAVTAPQHYQKGNNLYITGGYGVDSATGQFTTKTYLTVIDIAGLMDWVMDRTHKKAAHFIRQLSNPIFQITGGEMFQIEDHPTLLVFGQDFEGFYKFPPVTQIYSNQVRRFFIQDDGKKLKVKILPSIPSTPDPNFRRRDLNIVPIVKKKHGKTHESLVVLSGVFTETTGVWTVPVEVTANGIPSMKNPNNPNTFKQGMNNYNSAFCNLFSEKRNENYMVLLGGMTFGDFQNGQFTTSSKIPFTSQITAIRRKKSGEYKQFFMGQYPTILSTQSHAGNPLLFGSNANFISHEDVSRYENHVIKFDKLKKKKTVVGYIVGGIQSTVPNTEVASDSAASPYIFEVIIEKN